MTAAGTSAGHGARTPASGWTDAYVDLYWLPLGAGGVRCVRWNGRLYEAVVAHRERRAPANLYHSALEVGVGADRYVIEMAPVWRAAAGSDRGVVAEGAVGLPWLRWSRLFRYEVRCWRGGTIPDVAEAVASPQRVSTDADRARRVLELVPSFPMLTWGRDELRTGDMWNSNSLISWLLAGSGHRIDAVALPGHGRAPGWTAGLAMAARTPAGPAHRRRNAVASMPAERMRGTS